MTSRNTNMPHRKLYLLVVILLALPISPAASEENDALIVFAAASLAEPLTTLGRNYQQRSGSRVIFSFAASSTLARQIFSGASPDVYLSANKTWMRTLDDKGLLIPGTRQAFLSNELVIATAVRSELQAFTLDSHTDLLALLQPGQRIAVGDPDHVPVGIYAKYNLTRLGLWPTIEPMLARTDNTRATVALLERGEAPFGFVYKSDTNISSSLKILAKVPQDKAYRIVYEIAAIKSASEHAHRFIDYLKTEAAQAIFSQFQFVPLRH